jgi:hypothetical protein
MNDFRWKSHPQKVEHASLHSSTIESRQQLNLKGYSHEILMAFLWFYRIVMPRITFFFMFSYLNFIIYDFFSSSGNPDWGTEFILNSDRLSEKLHMGSTQHHPKLYNLNIKKSVKRDMSNIYCKQYTIKSSKGHQKFYFAECEIEICLKFRNNNKRNLAQLRCIFFMRHYSALFLFNN